MRNLNLDQVQTLVAIADLGTLAAAARALHLAPPTVSLHISELESRLGATLLHRGRRQASLTPAGEALVQGGRLLLAGADEVTEQVRRRAQGLQGVVRLSTTAGVSSELLPRVLALLARDAPGVDLKLDVLSSAEAMARLKAGALDLGLVALPQAASTEVQVRRWRRDPMKAFIPADWDAPQKITPQWLAARAWIAFGPATQMYRLTAAWFAQAGLNPRPRLELNHPQAIKRMVAAGYGVAVLPLDESDAATHAGLRVLPLAPALTREMGIAHRVDQAKDVAVQSVVRALAEAAAKDGSV
jgi:DNA-binding transcriptional LysR family regulator